MSATVLQTWSIKVMIIVEKYSDTEVAVETPYKADFINELKDSIDPPFRRWNGDKRAWIIRAAVFSIVHEIIDSHYPDEVWQVSETAQELIQKSYSYRVVYPEKQPDCSGPRTVLHVTDDAPDCVVQAAYKALARMHHPDVGGSREVMSKVNAAYEEIKKGRW